jgi:hypothetical protein
LARGIAGAKKFVASMLIATPLHWNAEITSSSSSAKSKFREKADAVSYTAGTARQIGMAMIPSPALRAAFPGPFSPAPLAGR